MQVRVMKRTRKGNKGTLYSCSHLVETFNDDGIIIELCNFDGREGIRKLIKLPRDGYKAYYMDNNRTIDVKVWPPKSKDDRDKSERMIDRDLEMRG